MEAWLQSMVLLGRYQIEAWFRNCWWTTWTVHANDISMLWFRVFSFFLSLFFAPLICIRTCWWSDANWNSSRNGAITCNTKLCLIWLPYNNFNSVSLSLQIWTKIACFIIFKFSLLSLNSTFSNPGKEKDNESEAATVACCCFMDLGCSGWNMWDM